jgi:predicted porin
MTKRLMAAAAALALAPGMAAAQGAVTVYGNIDLGVLTRNHAPAGETSTSLANGGLAPSIWGVRGAEDLGNGLKAVFNLEGHYAADTGLSDARLFRRQSNVGLSSASFGTVLVGNQYSPAILAYAATDPRGLRENFSALYSWAYNSGALTSGNNGNHDAGVFLLNAVSYGVTQGQFGIGAAYSVSEGRGAVYSLGATYNGPVTVSAAWQSTNKPGTSDRISTLYTVGAGYSVGAVTGKVNYLRGVNRNAMLVETSDVGVAGVGVEWKTAANNTVMAAAYFAKDKNRRSDRTTTWILSDEYTLSRRTTLYGTLTYASAKSGATLLTTVVAGGTAASTDTSLLNVGVRHSF